MFHQNKGVKARKKKVGTLGNKDTTRARGKGHLWEEGTGQRAHEKLRNVLKKMKEGGEREGEKEMAKTT